MKIIIEGEDKKYYNKKPKGWSPCIYGNKKHRDHNLNVLPNCVGWATGRFNQLGQWGKCKYLGNTNAENFTNFCKKQRLELGQEPKVGACMVWEGKGKLAGHVAIVEEVISSKKVTTSESGWSAKKSYWTSTRKKGSTNNWGGGKNLKFKGFIYNPAELDYQDGTYKIIVSKTLRKSMSLVKSNRVKVKECDSETKKLLTSKKANDIAMFKLNVIIELSNIIEKDNRKWMKYKDYYIVVENKDGTKQVEKTN